MATNSPFNLLLCVLSRNFDLKFLREAELKHGRVAMLAIVGFIFPELVFHLPGEAYSALNPIVAASQVEMDYPCVASLNRC